MSALLGRPSTAAFDGLYRKHAATVYRYTLAVLGNHADAEDVTQTTFMNAYRALAQGVKPRKAENWLLTIAHNQIRQHFRRTLAKPLEVELDETTARAQEPDDARSEPTVADVLRALQKLTPAQRSAIVMREFEGRSYAEMAQILGLTPSALEALLFRARRALAEQLEEALTCEEAELAVSRRLDGRLARREARRLKAHMRECPRCARFDQAQRRHRQLLKGLSVIPVPASLFVFRPEPAAAAAGLGAAGAGAGAGLGVTAAGAGGVAGAGVAVGVAAKVAAVSVAAAAAVGGVGYGVTKVQGPSDVDRAAALAQTREGARAAQVRLARERGRLPGPAATASDRARAATAAAHTRKAAAQARAAARKGGAAATKGRAAATRSAKARAAGSITGRTKAATVGKAATARTTPGGRRATTSPAPTSRTATHPPARTAAKARIAPTTTAVTLSKPTPKPKPRATPTRGRGTEARTTDPAARRTAK